VIVLAGCGRFDFTSSAPDAAPAPFVPLTWQAQDSGTAAHLWDVLGVAGELFVPADDSAIMHSPGDGTWTREPLANGSSMYGIAGSSPSDMWAVGNVASAGIAVFHRDATGTWTFVPTPFTDALNSVVALAPDDIYAAGYRSGIGHFDGSTWTRQPGPAVNLFRLFAISPSDLYLVGDSATLLHSTGDGTWTPQVVPTTEDLIGIWASSASDIYAAGHNGTILHSIGDGTWTAQTTGVTTGLWALWGSGARDIYAAGEGSIILHSAGDGTWTPFETGTGVSVFEELWGTGPDDVYLVGDGGTILHGTR
jgi:hypothetical protein